MTIPARRWLSRVCMVSAVLLGAALSGQNSTMFPPVRGTHQMAGAANNMQVEAAWRVLTAGGNAIDAGAAATLTAAVTEQSRFGLGGEMPLLVRMAGKPPVAISGIGTAPKLATVDYYRHRKPEAWEDQGLVPPIPSEGIKSAIVPGMMDGVLLALQRFGTRSYCEVAAPAIEAAGGGFPIPDEYGRFIYELQRYLQFWPDSAKFFLPEGRPPQRGEIVTHPTLAATLQSLCTVEQKTSGNRVKKLEAVRHEFYRGSIAKKIAAFSEANEGLIRYEDLAGFHAEFDEPVSTTYRGYTIIKPGFWTQGPVMVEALNLLEGFDLKSMGHNSPQYLHTLIEAVKLAFADRDRFYGDPHFAQVPAEQLLSKSYAEERRKLIDPAHASIEHRPGPLGPPMSLDVIPLPTQNANDTTCVNVVDKEGNAYSATPSGAWLPSVIAGDTGIPLSTRLQSFVLTEGHPNQLAPGKRPRVTLSPTLVLKDGKTWLLMSTPGGDNQDQAMLQVLLNLIEFGMGPQEAAESPRFQTQHFYSSFANHEFLAGQLNVEARIPPTTIHALEEKGHKIRVMGPWSNGSAPTLIRIQNGVLEGGADPRRSRYIFGR